MAPPDSVHGEETLSDIDDEEVNGYLFTAEERNLKTMLWEEMYKDWEEEQKKKQEERDARPKPKKKEPKPPPAATAAEAVNQDR